MTNTIRRGPTLKQQQANKLQGARHAGLRLGAETIVDNNADLTADYFNAKTGDLGTGVYTEGWAETTYIQRDDQGKVSWVELTPKEVVLAECDRHQVSPSFSLSVPAKAVLGWTEAGLPVSAKSTSTADQNLTYPITPAPEVVREEGFVPATAAQRDAAVAEQYKAFGAVRSAGQIKTSHPSYKVAKKQAALHGTLTVAFATRNAYASEGVELGEVAYLDNRVEEEDTTTNTIAEIYSHLNLRQVQVAELLVDGKTQKDIAEIMGTSPKAISQVVIQIRTKLANR